MKNNILSRRNLHTKKTSGNDERYGTDFDETDIHEKIYILRKNLEKKRLLDILQNENISINSKLEELKDNRFTPPDIKSGGLFNDFDFEF
jgi:hypothetical protein